MKSTMVTPVLSSEFAAILSFDLLKRRCGEGVGVLWCSRWVSKKGAGTTIF